MGRIRGENYHEDDSERRDFERTVLARLDRIIELLEGVSEEMPKRQKTSKEAQGEALDRVRRLAG